MSTAEKHRRRERRAARRKHRVQKRRRTELGGALSPMSLPVAAHAQQQKVIQGMVVPVVVEVVQMHRPRSFIPLPAVLTDTVTGNNGSSHTPAKEPWPVPLIGPPVLPLRIAFARPATSRNLTRTLARRHAASRRRRRLDGCGVRNTAFQFRAHLRAVLRCALIGRSLSIRQSFAASRAVAPAAVPNMGRPGVELLPTVLA